jgi:hypothetical protein
VLDVVEVQAERLDGGRDDGGHPISDRRHAPHLLLDMVLDMDVAWDSPRQGAGSYQKGG